MDSTPTSSHVLDRLITATNTHDLDALVDCFAVDYELTDPVHPVRSFTGSAQVRKNWATLFAAMPDVHLDVGQQIATADGFWMECSQLGTRRDGVRLDGRMVFIAKVEDDRISSAHIYVAQVETDGPDIDAVFATMAGTGAGGTGPSALADEGADPVR